MYIKKNIVNLQSKSKNRFMEGRYDNISLSKSPIIEMTLDIVCSYNIPTEAVVGVLYTIFQRDSFFGVTNIQGLPVLNLPEAVRENEANLRNKPTHRIECRNGLISVGPHILSISILPPYKSWSNCISFIKKAIENIRQPGLIKEVGNINLRYLNFFKSNIFDNIELNINLRDKKFIFPSTIFKVEIPSEKGRVKVLQITNKVHVKNIALGFDDDGSLLDIIVVSKTASLDSLIQSIEESHQDAKNLFFDLLKKDFVNSLI